MDAARWFVALGMAGCGRVGFDSSGGASDAVIAGDAVPSNTAPSGLVLSLDLDGTAVDSVSGAAMTCDPQCPTYLTGHVGQAAQFDHAACLVLADRPALHVQRFTVSLWFLSTGHFIETLVGKPLDPANGVLDSFELFLNGGIVSFTSSGGAANRLVDVAIDYTPNVWHHVAGTFDGTIKRLYFDGAEQANMTAAAVAFDASPLLVGCDIDNGTYIGHADDRIDQVRLYDHALTAAEIALLAQ